MTENKHQETKKIKFGKKYICKHTLIHEPKNTSFCHYVSD